MNTSTDEQYWLSIAGHTATRNNGAPWTFQLQVASLVGKHTVVGSVARYSSGGETSTWSVLAVTDDARLIRAVVEYDAELFDREQEQEPWRKANPANLKVQESWVRRLSDVVRLDIGTVRARLNNFGETLRGEVNIGSASLKFSDGFELDLEVDQVAMHDRDERARSDAFLDAVRKHTGL